MPRRAEVIRRSDGDDVGVPEPARDQPRVRELTDAHRDVDGFVHHVHQPVGEAQLQRDIGKLRQEARQGRNYIFPGECQRHVNAQPPARALACFHDLRLCVLQLGYQRLAACVECVADVSGTEGSRRTVEQAYAETSLRGATRTC